MYGLLAIRVVFEHCACKLPAVIQVLYGGLPESVSVGKPQKRTFTFRIRKHSDD